MSKTKHKPLTAKQYQAAELLSKGHTCPEVAEAVKGITARSIRRWKLREDFRALVNRGRLRRADENPTARAVLEDCLTACHSNGKPDQRTRLTAARALLPIEDAESEGDGVAERVTYIYADGEADGADE